MDHSLLSIWDLIIIGAYLILMVLVGVYSVKRIKNTGDYYVAGRNTGASSPAHRVTLPWSTPTGRAEKMAPLP